MNSRDCEYQVSLSDMVMCLSGALDLVNVRISDHNEQVACISFFIAEALGMRGNDLVDVTLAGLLHDIGALSLKERLDLLKYDIEDTRRHSELGSRFLATFQPLAHLAPVVLNHHARWSHGRGRSAEGRPVSDASFIIHLADRISILINRGEEILTQAGHIIETIREGSGSIYVPEHVDAFLSIADREFFWFISASAYFETYLADRLRPLTVNMDAALLMQMAKLFGRVIDFRSSFTAIHSSRVSSVSRVLADKAGLPADEVETLAIAGYLHDLGKLVVPPEILDKPHPLSAEEWNVMKSHSFHTWRLLNSLKGIDAISRYASSHHERLDGKGYPFRYAAGQLSQGERIVAVADVFTALIEDRPYRPGMTVRQTFQVLDDMIVQNALDGDCIDVLKKNNPDVIDAIVMAERETLNEYAAIVRDRDN